MFTQNRSFCPIQQTLLLKEFVVGACRLVEFIIACEKWICRKRREKLAESKRKTVINWNWRRGNCIFRSHKSLSRAATCTKKTSSTHPDAFSSTCKFLIRVLIFIRVIFVKKKNFSNYGCHERCALHASVDDDKCDKHNGYSMEKFETWSL